MIKLIGIILRVLPWLLVISLMLVIFLRGDLSIGEVVEGGKETYQRTILTKVEQMGNLELVKYNFQEVTEVTKMADYVNLLGFKYRLSNLDSKAVLISQGSAAGCIDLTRLNISDLVEEQDTLYVSLPQPELCYFKIDLEKSRIYDLQVTYLRPEDRKAFIQELYKVAEAEIRTTALETGILEQTRENADLILKPILENLSGKTVIITFQLDQSITPDESEQGVDR